MELRWATQDATGPGTLALASTIGMAWPFGPYVLRTANPAPMQVRGILGVFDTRGTAYKETVNSFKTATGKPLPTLIGGTIVLYTLSIWRAWKKESIVNAHRVTDPEMGSIDSASAKSVAGAPKEILKSDEPGAPALSAKSEHGF